MKKAVLSKFASELVQVEAYGAPEEANKAFSTVLNLENNDLRRLFRLLLKKQESYKKAILALWNKIDPASLKQTLGDTTFDYSEHPTNDLRRMEKQLLLARDLHGESRAIARICERLACDGSRLPKDFVQPDENLINRIESAQSVTEVFKIQLAQLSAGDAWCLDFLDRRLTHVQQLLNQRLQENSE